MGLQLTLPAQARMFVREILSKISHTFT